MLVTLVIDKCSLQVCSPYIFWLCIKTKKASRCSEGFDIYVFYNKLTCYSNTYLPLTVDNSSTYTYRRSFYSLFFSLLYAIINK